MSIAYACILVAFALPYLWAVIAKRAGERYDNRDPRGWMQRQSNPLVHRANAAQANAFEAFAPFAAGVLMAQLAGVDPARISTLSMLFVGLRIGHGLAYVANRQLWRSIAWLGGWLCVIVLMILAIAAIG